MRYENEICQGCGRVMQEGDDIVVCPECGTPQHRECYKAGNKCVNEHLHEDNYVWRPKHTEEAVTEKEEKETVVCPFCHHENDADAKECSNCGQPFELFGKNILSFTGQGNPAKAKKDGYAYKPPFQVDEPQRCENGYQAPVDNGTCACDDESFSINGQLLRGRVEEINNKDLALYLRSEVPKYHGKFRKIQKGGKTFNWAAFLFMPYWFFYRKLVKPGIIFMSLSLLLTVLFYNPMMEYMNLAGELSSQMSSAANIQTTYQNGEPIPESERTDPAVIDEQMKVTSEKMQALMPAIMAYAALVLLLRLVAGLLADKLYKKKVVSDITDINFANDLSPIFSEEYQEGKQIEYMKRGGTSFGYTALAYGAEYFIGMIITGLLTGI